jgi:hypothetical protein
VLINVFDLLPARLRQGVRAELGAPVFVGVTLTRRDAGEVLKRLDGAAAEASARLLARLPKKPAKSAGSRAQKRR